MTSTPTIAAQIEALAAEIGPLPIDPDWMYSVVRHGQRNMDLEVSEGFNEPLRQCGDAIGKLINLAPAIVTALRRAEAYPQHIDDLHLGDRLSNGERLCSHGHTVTQDHPLYWPQQISQYDDRDPFCLEHAIEREIDQNSDYPETDTQAEAAPGVVEAPIKGPLRFVDEGHPLGLFCYDRNGQAVSLHPAIMGAVFQILSRQPFAVDAKVEYPAFKSWWARTIPNEVIPSSASHTFDAWMASARQHGARKQ